MPCVGARSSEAPVGKVRRRSESVRTRRLIAAPTRPTRAVPGGERKSVVVPGLRAGVLRACEDHGYFDGGACPDCGADGRPVLGDDRRTRLSKFLSGALRHFPDDAGLDLDGRGWTEYDALVAAVDANYGWADRESVDAVIATDPKGRFERRGGRVRAAYGHSVDVDLEASEGEVPDRLYHGTAPRNLDAIRDEGLKPMGRQRVHLSATRAAARAVGRRHAPDPAVLVVDVRSMLADGFAIDRRGEDTFTVERVPPEYLDGFDDDRVADDGR